MMMMMFKTKIGQVGPQCQVRTPEMGNSVNVFILADRNVVTEDIAEQVWISVAQKIMYDDICLF